MTTLHVLQQDNNNMHQAFEQLHIEALPAPQNPEGVGNKQVFKLVLKPIREPSLSLHKNLMEHGLNIEVLSIKLN
jgi:hypothetical protein